MESYKKMLEMESVAESKLEEDKKNLEEIRKVLYQDKNFILDKLVIYLKRELNIDYYKYKIKDIDNNIADILVKSDSKIFKQNIEGKEYLDFNVEELTDSRLFDNKDEIIIIDINFDENLLDLGYICDSLNYNFLSYSDTIKEKLSTFVNYVISKKIYKNKVTFNT